LQKDDGVFKKRLNIMSENIPGEVKHKALPEGLC